MTIAWMMYVLLIGGLFAIGAWCIEEALRSAGLPIRWVWAGALLGTVAFAAYALTSVVTPMSNIPVLTAKVMVGATPATLPPTGILATLATIRATIAGSIVAAMSVASARIPADVARLALFAWAAASVVLLLVHLMVNRRVISQRREWPIARLPGGTARVSPTLGPAVIGLASPEIVVPQWLLEKSSDEQRLVMVHEQEHIAARDQYLPVGALLVATLFPWHPAVWWSLARLRLAVELDCDARVLRRGVQAQSYGTLLIDIAAQCGGHRVGALALADRTSHLERRIRAMTHKTSRFTIVRTIGLASVAALAIVTACEARLPTSAEVQTMNVASAEKAMVQSKMLDERAAANVVYVVNRENVSAEKAHAIAANSIVSVNVIKGSTNKDGSASPTEVRIATTDAALSANNMDFHSERDARLSLKTGDTLVSGVSMKIYTERGGAPMVTADTGTLTGKTSFTGLVFVDGVLSAKDALSKLQPAEIASVEVLKGKAATEYYATDPAAANGVIRVTTKHAKQ